MSCHAKPTLLLIGSPWQHSNASQSGRVFVPRKAVLLIWHKHVMDNPPPAPDVPAQQWLYLSMYMLDIDASTDAAYVSHVSPASRKQLKFRLQRNATPI